MLGVIAVFGSQTRISIRLQTEGCISFRPIVPEELFKAIIIQVNLQSIHLVISHNLHIILKERKRNKLSTAIYHKATHSVVRKVTDRILLTAPESIGVYWGTRTLLQIAEQSENHQFPKGTLRDFPDYAMRGFMIDCGRKFIPLSFLQD